MRRDCLASFHFSNRPHTAKRRSLLLFSRSLFPSFSPFFLCTSLLDYGKKKEEKKRSDRKREREAQREVKRTEGRKEESKQAREEGVLGEVSRGRGAISRLSIMEPVRSYREPAAGEEPAFHPTNLS